MNKILRHSDLSRQPVYLSLKHFLMNHFLIVENYYTEEINVSSRDHSHFRIIIQTNSYTLARILVVSFLSVSHQETVEYQLFYEDLTTIQYRSRLDANRCNDVVSVRSLERALERNLDTGQSMEIFIFILYLSVSDVISKCFL